MSRPLFRNASSRRRCDRVSKLNSIVSKILESGLKLTLVPRLSVWRDRLQRSPLGVPRSIALDPDFPAPPDLKLQPLGQRIHDGNTNAMQSARNFIGIVVEFAAGVQFRKNDLRRRLAFLRHDFSRNSAAVVDDGYGSIDVDGDVHLRAITRQRLVDRVIDNFVNQMV